MADTYFFISFLFWVLGIIVFVAMMIYRGIVGKKGDINPLVGLFIGSAIAMFVLYWAGNANAESGGVERFLLGLLGTIRAMTGENGVFETRELIQGISAEWMKWFALYTAWLHFTASGVIVAFLLKVVDRFFPKLKYRFLSFHKRSVCVFSGISEREVLLAEDLRKNERSKHSVIVFLRSGTEQEDGVLVERIEHVQGYIFDESVDSLALPFMIKRKRVDYFLLKELDNENINDALKLAEKYPKDATEVYVHVLSDNSETEALLDSVSGVENCNFRLISETKIMLYQLLSEKPLFMGNNGDEPKILVVGAGRNGMEAVKVCSWCGWISDKAPEIWVIDKTDAAYLQLMKECPEITNENVHFENVDVQTPAFCDFMRAHKDIGYVICALGDEHLNLRTAMEIRKITCEGLPFEDKGGKLPIINVLLNDDALYQVAERMSYDNKKKNEEFQYRYELNGFGSFKEFYTWENIAASYLSMAGLAVHRAYSKQGGNSETDGEIRADYERLEYGRSSSMAAALHGKYKAYSCMMELPENERPKVDWTVHPDETVCRKLAEYLYDIRIPVEERLNRTEKLAILEHERWNAYTRALGFRSLTPEEKQEWDTEKYGSKNMPGKIHACLAEWSKLDEGTKNYDRALCWRLPTILYEGLKYKEEEEKGKVMYRRKERGFYSLEEIAAILYWNDKPAKENEKIVLTGKSKMVAAFLKQALLVNIYDSTGVKYVVRCDKDISDEFAEALKEIQVEVVFEKVEKAAIKGLKAKKGFMGGLAIERDKKVKGENRVIREEKPFVISEERLKEYCDELLEKANAIHDYYKSQYGGESWKKLSAHKKSSNISSAAHMERHRAKFVIGTDIDEMAKVEHERWNRFHFLNGWKWAEVRNDAEKLHNCLVRFEELSEEEVEKDRRSIEIGLRLL